MYVVKGSNGETYEKNPRSKMTGICPTKNTGKDRKCSVFGLLLSLGTPPSNFHPSKTRILTPEGNCPIQLTMNRHEVSSMM